MASTSPVARLGVDIVANDKTARGFASAERRAGKVGANAARKIGDADRVVGRSSGFRSAARTFLEVDQAANRAFGNASPLGRLRGRIGDVRALGGALGSGFGRASVALEATEVAGAGAAAAGERAASALGKAGAAGEIAAGGIAEAGGAVATLGAALGPVGIGLAATAGLIAATGYAGYKFASGWAYGAAALGRLSDRIGIAVEDIQKLQQAGERFGIDKAATGGALASFTRLASDADNARNPGARVLMRKLGMDFTKKADGTLDYSAMLSQASRGIAAQRDPVIQAMVAEQLGLSEMLPLLKQGPAAVARETADVGSYGSVALAADINKAREFVRSTAQFGQLAGRQDTKARVAATTYALPILGAGLSAGRQLTEASEDPAKRSAMIEAGKRQIGDAANMVVGAASTAAQVISKALDAPSKAISKAGTDMLGASANIAVGLTRAVILAARAGERRWGVPSSVSLAQYGVESAWGRRMPVGSNNPFGIKARRGEPFVEAMTTEHSKGRDVRMSQRFRRFSSIDEAFEAHAKLLGTGRPYGRARAALPSVDAYTEELAGTYATDPNYGRKLRRIIDQHHLKQYDHSGDAADGPVPVKGNVSRMSDPIPVKVDVHLHGGRSGDRIQVTAGHSKKPAISHAMTH